MPTNIPYADETWNPVTGCTPKSEGCKHCFAAGVAKRFWGERKFSDIQIHGDRIHKPFTWKKPRRVFVNSMSDLFHDDVPFKFIDRIFAVMALCPEHSFLILTKRPERMKEYFDRIAEQGEPVLGDSYLNEHINGYRSYLIAMTREMPGGNANWRWEDHEYHEGRVSVPGYFEWRGPGKSEDLIPWPLRNVYLGVTAENQQMADERMPILLEIPAGVRFVSVEPQLSEVNIQKYLCGGYPPSWGYANELHWVIAGAESGPKRRPFDLDWARSLRDQCQAAGTPFFFKQGHDESGRVVHMPELDGVVHNAFPKVQS